jgi:hypothetical protein
MRIQDFQTVCQANTEEEIEAALSKRYDERGKRVNALWLSHDHDKHPAMYVLVNGDLSSLHFFTAEREPGFESDGGENRLPPGGLTTFYMGTRQEQPIMNEAVLPFRLAVEAAKEFGKTRKLPTCVKWFAL